MGIFVTFILNHFGSYISVVGICSFFVVVTITSSSGNNKRCAPSPWAVEQNSTTLEWMVQSPPAFHTFGELPAIKEKEKSKKNMIPEDDLELGQLRLLEVDNRVVVPAKTHLRFIVTSADVLHSWAVPSLGVKCDAVPGRLTSPSNWTSWFVVIFICIFDIILLFLPYNLK